MNNTISSNCFHRFSRQAAAPQAHTLMPELVVPASSCIRSWEHGFLRNSCHLLQRQTRRAAMCGSRCGNELSHGCAWRPGRRGPLCAFADMNELPLAAPNVLMPAGSRLCATYPKHQTQCGAFPKHGWCERPRAISCVGRPEGSMQMWPIGCPG